MYIAAECSYRINELPDRVLPRSQFGEGQRIYSSWLAFIDTCAGTNGQLNFLDKALVAALSSGDVSPPLPNAAEGRFYCWRCLASATTQQAAYRAQRAASLFATAC